MQPINNTDFASSSMLEEPLVSVLVPSYNHEKYIIECLESIKESTYPRLELIVSDDVSSDRTYPLAEEWAQQNAGRFERAIVVRQAVNLGIVKNLQFLFDTAQGHYLTSIASDDLLVASGISDRVEILENNKEIDAVFGNANLVSGTGELVREKFIHGHVIKELTSKTLLVASLLLNWCVPGPVMLMRKEAVLENGSLGFLPVDLKAEDRYIYIRLASKGKLMFLDKVVAKYRTVVGSMSRPSTPSNFIIGHIVVSDRKNKHLLNGFDRAAIETRIARNDLELQKGNTAVYSLKRLLWRSVTVLLRAMLFVRASIVAN